jgi:hypothetical protein
MKNRFGSEGKDGSRKGSLLVSTEDCCVHCRCTAVHGGSKSMACWCRPNLHALPRWCGPFSRHFKLKVMTLENVSARQQSINPPPHLGFSGRLVVYLLSRFLHEIYVGWQADGFTTVLHTKNYYSTALATREALCSSREEVSGVLKMFSYLCSQNSSLVELFSSPKRNKSQIFFLHQQRNIILRVHHERIIVCKMHVCPTTRLDVKLMFS